MIKKLTFFFTLALTVFNTAAMETRQTKPSPLSPLAQQLVNAIKSLRAKNKYQKNPQDTLAKRMEIALREFTALRINPLESARPGVMAETIIHLYSDDVRLLHMFIRFYSKSESLEALNTFLQGTIQINERLQHDDAGRTLLHCAAQDGEPDVVEWLLAREAQRDIGDSQKKTPLTLAESAIAKASPAQQVRYQRIITLLTAAPLAQVRQGATTSNRANVQGMIHMSPQ
jgi:hypothetical protein